MTDAQFEIVTQLVLKGARAAQIQAHARTNWPDTTPTEILEAIERCRQSFVVDDLPPRLALAIAQRRALLLDAWRVNDYRTCLAILQDEAKLLRFYDQEPKLAAEPARPAARKKALSMTAVLVRAERATAALLETFEAKANAQET